MGKSWLEGVEAWVAETKLVFGVTGKSSHPCIASCFGAVEAVSFRKVWLGLDNCSGGKRLHPF